MKRAQVTIFVVVGLLLVVGLLVFLFFRPVVESERSASSNPREFIRSCVEDSLNGAVQKVLDGGGMVAPVKVVNYSFDPVVGQRPYQYLCKTADFYRTCYNLQPMLEQTAELELEVETRDAVQACFVRLGETLQTQGFAVTYSFDDYAVNILPGQILVVVDADVSIQNGESSQVFDNFNMSFLSPLHSLIDLANKIVAGESTHCYFDYNGYMLYFPEFNIRRIDFRGSKIYHLIDRASGQTFKFAVRSCPFPLR